MSKVLYLISNRGFGRGGHFYSLRTTAESMSDMIECYIVTIGKNKSPVIDSSFIRNTTVHCIGWNFIYTIFLLTKVLKKEKPTIIHSFDGGSLFFGRILSYLYKIPHVHTKPGGANPGKYFPYIKDLILFSDENVRYFKSMNKWKDTTIYLIPNRVRTIKSDKVRIKLLRKEISPNKKTFLRIARISPGYKESIVQSINLVTDLNTKGINCQLILIGIPQYMDVYIELLEYIKKNNLTYIYLFTEDIFTINASELIDIADCVIGTGRSLMEAASYGKVLFTPLANNRIPVMITKENFEIFFNTNFSPRNKLSESLLNKNEENIRLLFAEDNNVVNAQNYAKEIFETYFNIDSKKEDYINIYKNTKYAKKNNLIDFLEDFARSMVNFTRKEL